MIAEQKLKRSQVGIELMRLLASEGDRVFSTDRARASRAAGRSQGRLPVGGPVPPPAKRMDRLAPSGAVRAVSYSPRCRASP